jgi:hypothetical protein
MAAIPPKKMLEELLNQGTLSAKERETFEGMWDAAHRYGRLSPRQVSWVEDAYYELKKTNTKGPRAGLKRSPRSGFVNVQGVTEPKVARSLERFKQLCPAASPTVLQRVEHFFKSGGEILRVLPASDPPKASKA